MSSNSNTTSPSNTHPKPLYQKQRNPKPLPILSCCSPRPSNNNSLHLRLWKAWALHMTLTNYLLLINESKSKGVRCAPLMIHFIWMPQISYECHKLMLNHWSIHISRAKNIAIWYLWSQFIYFISSHP